MYHEAIYAVLISFIINLILSPILIPFLIKLKFGQFVRDDGPKSHLKGRNPYDGWYYHS